jgi:dienelactone hydrolase
MLHSIKVSSLFALVSLVGSAFSVPAFASEKKSAHPKSVLTKNFEYKDGETILEGFLATPKKIKGKLPGVLVVHDWMGPSEYSEMRAKQLAELGYVALAVDIYGKGVRPKNGEEAAKLAGQYRNADRKALRARILAGFETLREDPNVDSDRIAAIGFCFGGSTVLELARSGAPVKAIVSFHGGLTNPNPNDAKNIKAKSLILHGAVDPFVPQKEVDDFQREMNDAKVDYQFISYSGAVHAFTQPQAGNDPSKGAAYQEVAEKRSIAAMKAFFKEVL